MKIENLFSIAGKVALVTGGSRGIGEMITAGFLANGAKVYISSRKADACLATAQRLSEKFDGECIGIPGDVCSGDFRCQGCNTFQIADVTRNRDGFSIKFLAQALSRSQAGIGLARTDIHFCAIGEEAGGNHFANTS